MSRTLVVLALIATAAPLSQAHAIGCLSGGAAGFAAGHVAGGHGKLGALAGCAYGHHRAVMDKRAAKAAALQQQQVTPAAATPQ